MKKLTLVFILLANFLVANAQISSICNNTLLDISFVPKPDSMSGSPQDGITLDAYNNCTFEYEFKVFIKDSMPINGTLIDIISLEILGFSGMPNGITNFQCDPPTCLFPPNSIGSIVISGFPNDVVDDYFLTIHTEFITSSIPVPLALDIPNPTVAPGEYRLTLNQTPPTCTSCSGFSAQINKTDDLCSLGGGSITFLPSGGTPPYLYSFCGNVPSSTTVSGLYEGIYLIEIVDANGCKLIETVEIFSASSSNVTTTNETCLLNDGTATISAFGSNFNYLWNTGATTQGITGLSTGFYVSTVTDITNQCTKVDTSFVEQDSTCIVYINGQVIWDNLNPDCTIDATSTYPSNKLVFLYKNGQLADMNNTDHLGQYAFTVDTGVYVIRVATGPYEVFACPTVDSVVLSALTPNTTYQEDFYQTLLPHQDLCVEYLNGPARPGFDQWHTISYCNYGTDTISGTITLVHDSILTGFDAYGLEDSYDPITFTAIWSFTDLPPGSCGIYKFKTVTPVGTTLGEILANTVTIGPTTNDIDLENNSSTVYNIVTGSYDPNDKQNLVAESTFSGPVYEDDDQFHYFIRFQNTGTDTAFTVVVKDEIDSNLDITSVRPLAASHTYDLTIEDQRTLVFTFNNILLVDSVTNEPASHGYLSFTIDLANPNSPIGTVIENVAGIYFDFNAPIITNTVVNTISDPLSLDDVPLHFSSRIYPNPTNGLAMVHLELEESDLIRLELVDVTGKLYAVPVLDQLFSKGEHLIPLELKGIPYGLLIVQVTVGGQKQSLKLVKME